MTTYHPITPEIVAELTRIVGSTNVVLDQDKLEAYSHDETPKGQFSGMPSASAIAALAATGCPSAKLTSAPRCAPG